MFTNHSFFCDKTPGTAEQIAWATELGFEAIPLDTAKLVDPATADDTRTATIAAAMKVLKHGKSLVLYSARGPDDPAIAKTNAHLEKIGLTNTGVGAVLGQQQGLILRALLEQTGLRRTVVCGGDTCGYVARQLGIFALQAVIPIAPGAPLCRASSDNPQFDGLEIALKGGQNGKANYFECILRGSAL